MEGSEGQLEESGGWLMGFEGRLEGSQAWPEGAEGQLEGSKGQQEGSEGQPGGDGYTYRHTYRISPHSTLSPLTAAAQKPCQP